MTQKLVHRLIEIGVKDHKEEPVYTNLKLKFMIEILKEIKRLGKKQKLRQLQQLKQPRKSERFVSERNELNLFKLIIKSSISFISVLILGTESLNDKRYPLVKILRSFEAH